MLHVTNGDSAAALLAGLDGAVLPWRDALHAGPVPAGSAAKLRRARAGFLAGGDADAAGGIAESLAERDRTLLAHGGDFVLWFEADLYDQLQLVQVVDLLAGADVAPSRVTVVCVGEYPGVARFTGLADLGETQLAGLLPAAGLPLTSAAVELARTAWDALRAPEPTGLAAVVAARSPVLRFVPEAFDRLGREYPSVRDGLSLTERRLLAAVDAGAATAGEAFARAGAKEPRPFLGDSLAFELLERLAAGDAPLLVVRRRPVRAGTRLHLTAAGADVLAGRADLVELGGVDRWIGGVHLHGRDVRWRWDEAAETVRAV